MCPILYRVFLFTICLNIVTCLVQFTPEKGYITYVNEKYVESVSFTIRRYSRKSPYYLNAQFFNKHPWYNNVSLTFSVYEYLHNEYRPSFVEVKLKFCDLLQNDKLLGKAVGKLYGAKCPLPAGPIRYNYTIPTSTFPNVFPFEKGRVYTIFEQNETGELMGKSYLDATFKNVIFEKCGILYVNDKYAESASFTVRRYGRRSPYYMNIQFFNKQPWYNNVTLTYLFYEYLHNEYRRSFLEVKHGFCDLLEKEKFIGGAVRLSGLKCPVPVGSIKLLNFTIPTATFPNVFPFEKGRVYTIFEQKETGELMGKSFLDATFKNEVKKKNNKPK